MSLGRSTIILCDTGLYGSTARLLLEGMPQKTWVAAQLAGSNYKGFATPNFERTIGLSVERDTYLPWNPRTSALRFWQLIEWLLEPELESVRSFTDETMPRSNLEVEGWQERIVPSSSGLFTGVLAYLDALTPGDLHTIGTRAATAWRQLRHTVIWPRGQDVSTLELTARSRDFGRLDTVDQFVQHASIPPACGARELFSAGIHV